MAAHRLRKYLRLLDRLRAVELVKIRALADEAEIRREMAAIAKPDAGRLELSKRPR